MWGKGQENIPKKWNLTDGYKDRNPISDVLDPQFLALSIFKYRISVSTNQNKEHCRSHLTSVAHLVIFKERKRETLCLLVVLSFAFKDSPRPLFSRN